MNVKPLAERVLVKVIEGATKTAGGIFIPQVAQEKTQEGIVVEVGNEVITLNVNDRIIYDKYAGTLIKVEGNDYLILKVADVLAIIA